MLLRCLESGAYQTLNGQTLDDSQVLALSSAGTSQTLVLVIPAQLCHFTAISFAEHERQHINRALPWRLEEHLLAPVETLHVAFTPVQNGYSAVTAIDQQYLQSLLTSAQAAGLVVRAVISEAELVPWFEHTWSVFAQGAAEHCILRYGPHQALVCQRSNLQLALQALADEQLELPHTINVFCEPDKLTVLMQQVPDHMQALVQIKKPELLQTAPATCCNLLQGAFAAPLPWGKWWQQWRMVAALLLALLLGDLTFTGLRAYQLQAELLALATELENTVQTVLPGAVLVDPMLQLRRAVSASGGGNNAGFLALLNRMTPVLASTGDAMVESMDYNAASGELQLLIQTGSFTTVEALRAGLQALGLSAELLGSSSDGARSRSRLRVKA